jgi:hypothetical protein
MNNINYNKTIDVLLSEFNNILHELDEAEKLFQHNLKILDDSLENYAKHIENCKNII